MSVSPKERTIDYNVSDVSLLEKIRTLGEGILLAAALNYLFYESLPACIPLLPVPFLYARMREKKAAADRRQRLNRYFKDALTSLSVSVQAGYSLENAVSGARRDLERMYPAQEEICREFRYMESQLRLSVPVEELFLDLGSRSGVEDIRNFASVLSAAKRTGGDTGRILQRCAQMVGDKIDVQQEIEASVAAKKREQTVMSLMPAAIIVYLKVTSPGFMRVLYGNIAGICVMTVCMAVYFGAWLLGKRITEAGYGFTRADFSYDLRDRTAHKNGASAGLENKRIPAVLHHRGGGKPSGTVPDAAGKSRGR